MKLNKVIIWGHKLHNHTHSYIHNAFYIAFKNLKFETYWFDEEGNNNYSDKEVDFNNALYITHGLESKNLPLNNTSFYIWHNVNYKRVNDFLMPIDHSLENTHKGIQWENILILKCYKKHPDILFPYKNKKYYLSTTDFKTLVIPWATDLLPKEIEINIKNLENIINKSDLSNPKINFVGMMTNEWNLVSQYSDKNNIIFNANGGTFDLESSKNKSTQENMELIQESVIAPAIQTKWQVDNNYIPCRIFKNISYGKMGMTNNKTVNELFNNKIIYNSDINHLLTDGINFEKNDKHKFDKIKELMIEVRDNHTYISRVSFILDFIKTHHNVHI